MNTKRLNEIIRVNHAGEHGAVAIYKGQINALKLMGDKKTLPLIYDMLEGEKVHAKEFDKIIEKKKTRVTALMPLWHLSGFTLGVASALGGRDTLMACTEAVEEVIDKHYSDQIKELEDSKKEPEILEIIKQFHEDELEHEEIAKNEISENTPALKAFKKIVKVGCRAAISLSEKI